MRSIRDVHVAEPGLDVAAADDATAATFREVLAGRWVTATSDRTTRPPGGPGVRLRCCLDLCRELPAAVAPTTA
ncbi:DUF6207 family protein [Streptomyces sp. NPDC003247]|uniref:DUF6207 family protein n=1 Tax=Streptomyces sp. NPDC003247 TaxID=3364677 RepID=UPI00368ADEEB